MATRGKNNGTLVIDGSATSSSPPRPLAWQSAAVEHVVIENYRVKTFTLKPSVPFSFKPGQYAKVRLTAEDGYQAQRSYSIGSSPETRETIDLTIELVDGGEVSPYFHQVVEIGDEVEIRGPIGGPFTWTPELGGPLLLIGGGSGIVPLMSMLRHRVRAAPEVETLLLYSSRSIEDVIFREELERISEAEPGIRVIHTLTRSQPEGWQGYSRRVDGAMLEDFVSYMTGIPHTYICGPTPFVETVADSLVELEVPAERIRTERFGPSG